MMEEIAAMAYYSVTLNAEQAGLPTVVRDKHHLRKHGPSAYYGQPQQ